MFHRVKCDVPLPDGWEAVDLQTKSFYGWDAFNLQTKHFGCEADTYTITRDGRLTRRYVSDLQDAPEEHSECEIIFHGVFLFYGTDTEKKRHEYTAKFTDGQLVKIEAVVASLSYVTPWPIARPVAVRNRLKSSSET